MADVNTLGLSTITATFTRPADTSAYVIGDLVANSVTAAAVVPMSWSVPFNIAIAVAAIRLRKAIAASTPTLALFRLHLYSVIPTIATVGDNGVFATNVTDVDGWIGSFDNSFMAGHAGSCAGLMVPSEGLVKPDLVKPGASLYGLLEARAAYVPGSAEVFTAQLILETRAGD